MILILRLNQGITGRVFNAILDKEAQLLVCLER